jgi:hypothetical protein
MDSTEQGPQQKMPREGGKTKMRDPRRQRGSPRFRAEATQGPSLTYPGPVCTSWQPLDKASGLADTQSDQGKENKQPSLAQASLQEDRAGGKSVDKLPS